MKKLFAIALAVAMFASMATVVSAAENTTTLTTTVPAATYTLNIPADQEIAFGATETEIGNVTITNSSNFAEGKNVNVTLTFDGSFASEGVSTKIPYTVNLISAIESTYTDKYHPQNITSGGAMTFLGRSDGTVDESATATFSYTHTQTGTGSILEKDTNVGALSIAILSTDWGKALAGEYSTTITFTAEVVVEE